MTHTNTERCINLRIKLDDSYSAHFFFIQCTALNISSPKRGLQNVACVFFCFFWGADCSFVSCQNCAANQADWDTVLYGCSTTNSAKYLNLEDVYAPASEQPLPANVHTFHQDLIKKHGMLMDCLGTFRTAARGYREQLEKAVRTISETPGAATQDTAQVSAAVHDKLKDAHRSLQEHCNAAQNFCAMLSAHGKTAPNAGSQPFSLASKATALSLAANSGRCKVRHSCVSSSSAPECVGVCS
jgi:hypothetical protein